MEKAIDIAKYFLRKDISGELFNKSLLEMNGRRFYEGNARLNKYLHIAQNIYLAQTGQLLIDAPFYAYDNGAVIPEIQESYAAILQTKNSGELNFAPEITQYLDKIYSVLENASIDDLIEISHEDDEWIEKHVFYRKTEQKMNPLAHVEQYRKQYADIITLMERM